MELRGERYLLSAFEDRPTEANHYEFTNLGNMPNRRTAGRKGRLGMRLIRCRTFLPHLRFRITSPIRLLGKMRESYLRLILTYKKPDLAAVTPFYQHQSVTYSSDAIAECIEFIKKNAAAAT